MDLQLTIDVNTCTRNRNLDLADVFNRVLYQWDPSKESNEYRDLRQALLGYPQHAHVPPLRLILVLFRRDPNYRDHVTIHSPHRMGVQRLMEQAARSRRNGGYDMTLCWDGCVFKCSEPDTQQLVSLDERPSTEVQHDDDISCPFHQMNHLRMVLIRGDPSTYIPSRFRKLRMRCGRCPELILFRAPTLDAIVRAQQMELACNVDTVIMEQDTKESYGQVRLDNDGLVMVAWTANPLKNVPQPVAMDWFFSYQMSNRRFDNLLSLVGAQIRQLNIVSVGDGVVIIKLSQLGVMILNKFPLLHEISVSGRILEDYKSRHRQDKAPTYPHLRSLTVVGMASRHDPTPNQMVYRVLMLVGQSLRTLKLRSLNCPMNAMTARIISNRCPNLRALHVYGVDDTFCPALVGAFDQGRLCNVKSLTLSLCWSEEHADHPLLEALQDPTRAITRCLREFSVAYAGFQRRSILTEYIMDNMLSLNDTLVNVYLWGTKYEKERGQVLFWVTRTIPLRYIDACLSGLRHVLGLSVYNQFPIEVIQQIFTFSFTVRPTYRIASSVSSWARTNKQ